MDPRQVTAFSCFQLKFNDPLQIHKKTDEERITFSLINK